MSLHAHAAVYWDNSTGKVARLLRGKKGCQICYIFRMPAALHGYCRKDGLLRGFGHCAGMSQRGAEWMAKAYARDYREILAFYYPGMTLETLEWAPQTPEISVQTEKNATVTLKNADSSLNLRAEPSMVGELLMRLQANQRVIVLEVCDDPEWVHVKTDVVEGYCMVSYLAEEGVKPTPTAQ